MHSYDVPKSGPLGRVTLHHADLYRLDRTTEVADLALAELAEFDGIVLVEWGDVVETTFGDHLVVRLEYDDVDEPTTTRTSTRRSGDAESGDDVRSIEIAGVGPTWASRWSRVIAAVEAYRC